MKIAITSSGPSLSDVVDENVEACNYFIIINPDTYEYESLPNPDRTVNCSAVIQSAQLLARKNVGILLTGFSYSDKTQILIQNGIYVITGFKGPVRLAIHQYKTWILSIPKHPQ